MSSRLIEPIFTSVYPSISDFSPLEGSLYISGGSVEERSNHTELWEDGCTNVTFARVTSADPFEAVVSIAGTDHTVRLRSMTSIGAIYGNGEYSAIYLDITGLEHSVWAPLVRGLRRASTRGFCVYVEPGDYRFRADPTDATIFDLSERIRGVEPLPGFVSLRSFRDSEVVFVPILGFEGTRFTFLLENLQPDRRDVIPVIGVPGFRPEYPFYSYSGNRLPLYDTRAWQNVRLAPANCPFSLYQVLEGLRGDQQRVLRVAPIGTKPHALGAVLYYLDHSDTTELIYDHPIRVATRTVGLSRVCVYDVSLLWGDGGD